jgi:phage shock protein C
MTFRWVRARDGAIFGVCKGLSRAMNVPLGMLRLAWVLCTLFGGIGLGIYLLLTICLPREDRVYQAMEPKILGVCARLARRADLEVGVVRFLCLCFLFASLGITSILYLVGYFALPEAQPDDVASRNNPSNPPSTI